MFKCRIIIFNLIVYHITSFMVFDFCIYINVRNRYQRKIAWKWKGCKCYKNYPCLWFAHIVRSRWLTCLELIFQHQGPKYPFYQPSHWFSNETCNLTHICCHVVENTSSPWMKFAYFLHFEIKVCTRNIRLDFFLLHKTILPITFA